jgi:hypothetical protein
MTSDVIVLMIAGAVAIAFALATDLLARWPNVVRRITRWAV